MKFPIRYGDKLEHGGEITSASLFSTFMGRALARRDDTAQCDLHGQTTIAEGDEHFPIAMASPM